jgi:flagellar biogenesis protein FliO
MINKQKKQMKKINFFDIKNMLIILLGIIIIGMFLFGKNVIDKHEDEIKTLHIENETLLTTNDSLKNNNIKLDVILAEIDTKLDKNNEETNSVLTALGKLKGKKNEIPNYVSSLSANGTADALSKYLKDRTKGKTSGKH